MRRPASLLAAILLFPAGAFAQNRADENVTFGYAAVLSATPVYRTVRTRVPEERCDDQRARGDRDGMAGTVVGTVVGGALGNKAGKGDGRKAATLAGAVIGGVVGRRIDRNDAIPGDGCRTVEVLREERRVSAYDVEYQYKGETYMSRLASDPGNRLRIRVSVTPDAPTVGAR